VLSKALLSGSKESHNEIQVGLFFSDSTRDGFARMQCLVVEANKVEWKMGGDH